MAVGTVRVALRTVKERDVSTMRRQTMSFNAIRLFILLTSVNMWKREKELWMRPRTLEGWGNEVLPETVQHQKNLQYLSANVRPFWRWNDWGISRREEKELNRKRRRPKPTATSSFRLLTALSLLLIIAGDVELNPGPLGVGTHLGPDDLREVLKKVWSVSSKWFNIGLELELPADVLMNIRHQYSDQHIALREMLSIWLNGVGSLPTWTALVDALESRIVGAKLLAAELRVTYCSSQPVPVIAVHQDDGATASLIPASRERLPHLVPWEIAYSELEFGDEVGRGSYGLVYQGQWNSKSGSVTVAIKALKDPSEHKEAEILMRLRHRNILQFYGAASRGTADYYIVIEYAENGSLFEYIRRNPQPDLQKSLDWAKGIARGLRYLHGEKILHGDLKSHNVLFLDDWTLKICDFGSAKIYDGTITRTMQSTYAWAAPEVLNHKKVSLSCDIFSLGIVFWELLTHKRPFDGEQGIPVAMMIIHGDRPDLRAIPPFCPQHLVTLVTNCWNHTPKARPSAEDVVSALESRGSPAAAIRSPDSFETQTSHIPIVADERPSLVHLLKFPAERRNINLPQEISTNYFSFGVLLLEDATGARVGAISHQHLNNPTQINHQILQEWIQGKGKKPVTWKTLVQVLRDIELNVPADELELALVW